MKICCQNYDSAPSHPISCPVRLRNLCWRLMPKAIIFRPDAMMRLKETILWKISVLSPTKGCQAFLKRTPKSPCFFKWSLTQTWSSLSIDHLGPGFPPLHPWPVANRHGGAGSIVPADHHATWVWTDSKSLACRFESGLRGVYWACFKGNS